MRTAALLALLLSSDDARCSLELTLTTFKGNSADCYFDTKVRESGTLTAPCDEGPAHAQFHGQAFTGNVKDGQLSLSSRTEFDFSDGCRWESEQTITGVLRDGRLQFRYSERPIRGKYCASACSANGTFDIDCAQGECACVGRCKKRESSEPVSAL
jgi:hypothetical protein